MQMSAILFFLQLTHMIARCLFFTYNLNLKIKRIVFFILYFFVLFSFALCIWFIPVLSTPVPGLPFEIPYKLIIDILLGIVPILLLSSDCLSRKLTVFCWEKIILMSSELCCTLLYSGITGISPAGISQLANQAITMIVMVNILYNGVYFTLVYFVSYLLSIKARKKNRIREFTPAMLIIAIQILLFCTAVFQQEGYFSVFFTITAFVVMIICILSDIYLIIIAPPKTAENRALRERLQCMEEVQAGERDYFSSLLEKEHEMSALRHDWNNLLQVAVTQINEDRKSNSQNQTTIALIRSLIDRVNATKLTRYCQNEIVNVLLNAKAKALREKSIPFEIFCAIPEQIPMESLDLCSLMSHLINHAEQTCTTYPSVGNHISVSVKMPSTDNLAIRISIHMPLFPQHKFYKSKIVSNKRNEYDMKIVRSIMQKYNGNLDIICIQKTITASVLVTRVS
ncbi:MAG: hypothetical protein ACLU8W_10275 [Clostridia bacterium]